ncbi:redoxin domain-containing protein [Streptomyces sp. NPDC005065]|uniref:TlpA family protein disulfide reductase n=1 Tax=unclassified Streptomyces TaxID=2593676 RepID=UPI0033AA857B
MLYPITILSLLAACAACLLSVMVSLRVKKVLDPLIEEGAFNSDRPPSVPIGTEIPDYGPLTDVKGNTVTFGAQADDSWILAFLSTTCSGCKAQLPAYRDYLREQGVSPDRVISLVSGDVADLSIFTDEIGELSRIVHADDSSTIASDLQVSIWPTFLMISPHRAVEFATEGVSRLPQLENRGTRTPVAS